MKPDAFLYNPDPHYLRGLLKRGRITRVQAARALGINLRQLCNYICITGEYYQAAPYTVQFSLECLAACESPAELCADAP
jgi:hypothetical protein